MQEFKRYLWLSQAHLFGWLIVASIFASSVVFTNGGVSNYGNHYGTVLFYSCAFILSIRYLYLAAETLLLLSPKFKFIVYYLHILCMLLLLVYISTFPRRFGMAYSDIHDNVSKFLFVYEFVFGIWLLMRRPALQTLSFLLIMAGGSIVGLLSALHVLHLMFIGQMVGAFGFSLLLVNVLPQVITARLTIQHSEK